MGSFRRVSSIRHQKKGTAVKMTSMPSSLLPPPPINAGGGGVATGKAKKKTEVTRLWTRFDWSGAMEVVKCDKSTIIKRASVSARDLRIAFSNSSKILAKEKAIVFNLEGIKAIVTAEEVLFPDPFNPPVRTLIDRLKQQFPQRNGPEQASANVQSSLDPKGEEGLQSGLPFEFQVLEIALEVVCAFVDSNVSALETQAWSLLDELTKKVSTENLDSLRTLKSNISHLLARVHKVRDEIEHFLDDKEDMADLYLKRKWIQNLQQTEAASNSIVSSSNLHRLTSKRSVSLVTEEDEVEDLEMLLEAYFMQLDGIRNKILMMKEHIDGTEDYVKILQNGLRNGLINLMMIVEIANFAVTASNLVVNLFGMNIPMPLYDTPGIFNYFVMGVVALGIVLFTVTLAYLKRKKLLD